MRAALNIGFTVGALIGGVALAFNNDDIVRAVPVFTAAMLAAQRLLHHPAARAQHDKAPADGGRAAQARRPCATAASCR